MRSRILPILVLTLVVALPDTAGAHRHPIRPRGDVDVRIMVNGRTLPFIHPVGDPRMVQAREGDAYAIRVTNNTDRWVEVVAAVDGLDVIDGDRADYCHKRGYILGPGSSYDIEGWRTSMSSVDEFRFVHPATSEAARKGTAYSHLGWIQVAFFYGRMSASGPLYPAATTGGFERKDAAEPARGAADEEAFESDGLAEDKPAAKSGRAHSRPHRDWRLGTGRGGSNYAPAEETTFWRNDSTRPDRMINIKYTR
ncbi:MAG: hypothetical protein ABIK09_12215 [Pseudomonadota bacterium]